MRASLIRTGALAVLILAGSLGGCSSDRGQNETIGTVLGGIAGAVIGSQFGSGTGQIVATAAGTLAGAWIGNAIGRSLDEEDRQTAYQTDQAALENNADGESSSWSNPENNTGGSITPVNSMQSAGQECRTYEKSVLVDGELEQTTGKACRNSDGLWVEAS
jgi:surface antigen